jgi:hypothetical protein
LREWAAKREATAVAVFEAGKPYTSDIAFNTQPGHIPFRERLIAREDRACESLSRARDMAGRATGIGAQLDRTIFSDDPDAIERLEERIAELESKRQRFKEANATYRTEHKAELKAMSFYQRSEVMPHASWELTNLSADIRRNKQRLEQLKREKVNGKPMRWILARYRSDCEECGETIEKGAQVLYDPTERVIYCTKCRQMGGSADI